MPQVRAAALTGFVETASQLGIDGLQLMREMAIPPAVLADPERRLSASKAINLVEKAAERSDYNSFGLRMVASRTFASLGPIALLLQHLDTVSDVLAALIDNHRHIADILMLSIEYSDGAAVIKVGLSDKSSRQAVDIAVGATYLALRHASGGRWVPECVYFSHDPPDDLSFWSAMFRCPLEFGSSFDGFSCSSRSLAIPLPSSDAEMAEHARHLLGLIALPRMEEAAAERVRQAILLLLPTGQTTLRSVAKHMGISARTLQRRLDREQTTFAQLLNDVRRKLVERSLSDSVRSVSSIAEALGYNSVSAFSRWFSTEFGKTPSRWRAAHRQGAEGPPPMWRL